MKVVSMKQKSEGSSSPRPRENPLPAAPYSGKAINVMNELYSIILRFGGDVGEMGCDRKAANIGTTGCVCRLFEVVTGLSAQCSGLIASHLPMG